MQECLQSFIFYFIIRMQLRNCEMERSREFFTSILRFLLGLRTRFSSLIDLTFSLEIAIAPLLYRAYFRTVIFTTTILRLFFRYCVHRKSLLSLKLLRMLMTKNST